ncbi:MAG: glutamine synthetase III [Chitinophagales bacterium]|nr:glutamine synthetase III [Chitinophagales bacterium]
MNGIRYSALQSIRSSATEILDRNGNGHGHSKKRISEIFGQNTFSLQTMKEYLSEGTYKAIVAAVRQNAKIDFATAENVAKGLKKWATDNGVTHYTHWFQPLTGSTAEKHDAFYKPSLDYNVQGMENLTAAELVQREPDASSFPHGGLRSTAAARGYTVWDPSSPAFILETENGKTLYIPSIYISYTGESLDYKTPLLKSSEVLNNAATAVCHYFDENVHHVIATLGWEQEYFLVDENLYNARPDLMITGRTLFGGKPARNQQLEDHYFATIPERVQNYMQDFERECLLLGIPVLTRHNEVAPGQYECAPMFEELNTAVDHNLLLMNIMDRVARRHGLRVIFHEKPFAGVNGSGKHNNWSMATDKGKNLLSPGEKPSNNLYFLTFFINVCKALEANADLLRASIASAANEHRLGANEAPPAIISVFTGSLIEEVLTRFKKEGLFSDGKNSADSIDLNIPKIPEALLDNTDRNRTSPFPFTGNKFEFRAVGASANCSAAMMTLNTIVAHQLVEFKKEVDALIAKGTEKQTAIITILQRYVTEAERAIFNGDGYSKEWEKEANKRGLSNTKSTPDALKAFVSEKAEKIFTSYNIFNSRELHARYHVLLEQYIKQMEIEMLVIEEMVHTHILPSAFQYIGMLTDTYRGLKEMGLNKAADKTKEEVELVYNHFAELKENVKEMIALKEKAFSKTDEQQVAQLISDKIKPYFEEIRKHADQLEKLVDDNLWRLPKYRELLFVR